MSEGWIKALADKVHKYKEHIPQHCYTDFTQPSPVIWASAKEG